jgi:hypothetical protein
MSGIDVAGDTALADGSAPVLALSGQRCAALAGADAACSGAVVGYVSGSRPVVAALDVA